MMDDGSIAWNGIPSKIRIQKYFIVRNFRGKKIFCDSQKPQIFCILAELNFEVHVLEPISQECNFAVE